MRLAKLLLFACVVAALGAAARGAGSIDTTGAVFSFGAAPDTGTLTTDPAAPEGPAPAIPSLASLGTLGTFSSPLPAFAGGGTGADGAFLGSATQTLPGGTYDHTSYQVDSGVVVTYSGPVTILCTAGGSIDGTVRTTSANAPITLRFARGIELGDGAAIRTESESSPVTLDVGHGFLGGVGAAVEATGGDVELTSHGLEGTTGEIELDGTTLRTFQSGGVRVRAAGSLVTSGSAFLSSWDGDTVLQAFGGNVTCGGATRADTYGLAATILVEASGGVAITGDGSRPQLYHGGAGDGVAGAVSVKALGGDAEFLGATLVVGGPTRVAASGNVRVAGTSRFSVSGDATLAALGGDVRIEPTGGVGSLLAVGDLTVGATGNVVLSGDGTLRSVGKTDLRAPTGRVSATTGIAVGLSADLAGSVSISAGASGIDLGGAAVFSNAALDVTALGPVAIGGALGARSNVTVTSCDAGVDLTGASFQTLATAGVSGDVTVQSFGDAAGVIDAAGVSFTTDAAATKSGDVNLLVHAGKTGGAVVGETVDSYLLPTRWTTRLDPEVPARSRLIVAGVVDLGSFTVDLNAAATFEVAGLRIDFPAPVAKGTKLVFSVPGATLTLTPNVQGGSRVPFTLTRTGDLTGLVPTDGEMEPCYRTGAFEATGRIVVAGGRFSLKRAAGRLITPCYFPQSMTAKLRGGGKDTLKLVMGFATTGAAPAGIQPCYTVGFGTFSAEIPAERFTRRGERFTFKGNVEGITSVVVDYTKGIVTVKGRTLDLGAFSAGGNALAISMTVDTDQRTVQVDAVLTGTKLRY